MKSKHICVLLVIITAFFLVNCATQQPPVVEPLASPQKLSAEEYKPNVDSFLIILDASSSMSNRFGGTDRLTTAKNIVENINHTIPDVHINAALRTFGHSSSVSKEHTELMYGPTTYTPTGLSAALNKVTEAGGNSPMAQAITGATEDLATTNGDIALIIISDGENMGMEPVQAASSMKERFGERLCIYTIQVGGAEQEPGGVNPLLAKLADIGHCGNAMRADQLASDSETAQFVTTVLLTRRLDSDSDGVYDDQDQCPGTLANVTVDAQGCPRDTDGDGVADYRDDCPNTEAYVQVDEKGCPLDNDGDGVADFLDKCPNTRTGVKVDIAGCALDSDGDGIADYMDKCSGTPKGTSVDYAGCAYFSSVASGTATAAGTWVFKDVQFKSNSGAIDPKSFNTLDEIAENLKRNPDLKLEIQGHTDNLGSIAYNNKLSEKRAQAVEKYMLDKGVPSRQVTSAGYGPSMPIASNDSPGGRASNRRVEFKPIR